MSVPHRRVFAPAAAVALCFAAACLAATPALAADGGGKPSEAVFVGQVVALLVVGRAFGEIMLRLKQPAVVGQLIAGIVLGPSFFGLLAPHLHDLVFPHGEGQKAMIDGVANLGVLLLLFLTGMETDVRLVRAVGRPAASVSVTGIAVPFACGVTLGLFGLPDSLLPDPTKRLVTALFLGTALSISSIKIVAMVVEEMRFMRRNLGQIIVASAIIDDSIGWIIVGVTFAIARPGGFDAVSLVVGIGGTLAFLGVAALVGRRIVAGLVRWSNDWLVSERSTLTVILIVMGLLALATNAIGVNTVLGAFVAGVLMGQSPLKTREVEGELRGVVLALFAPIFFGLAGLSTDLTILADPKLLALTGGLILIASVGKFGGAFLGGAIGGLTRQECLALALGMNARGSTEVIVATIGLSIGALNNTLFTMIVTMAVVTTTIMPPTLRWALNRLPIRRDEAERLEKEAFEETSFLANIERLLLVADGGASGRLAERVVGLLGGVQQVPVTVLPLDGSADDEAADHAVGSGRREAVEAAYRHALDASAAGEDGADVDVIERPGIVGAPAEAVSNEARKGYGLVVIGKEAATAAEGGLHPDLVTVLGSFAGARAIVVARGPHAFTRDDGPLKILVPATGTEASRRAVEVGVALAKAQGAAMSALFVADPDPVDKPLPDRRAARQKTASLLAEVKAEVADLAHRHAVEVETLVRQSDDKDASILGVARRGGDNLIVLGVSPRASETMPFGALAGSLLEGSPFSLLLIVSQSTIGVSEAGRG